MYLYNIIILYLLIGVIVNYIIGINFSTLSCGIFAWVGKDTKFFRRDLFNILGMYNDSRGGDACGVYFDDNWYKGISTSAKYEKLIVDYNLHNTLKLKSHPVIIGHDRKVSVGYLTIANAQPVILEDSEQQICYVQAHNGTITNYRALANKYKVNIEVGESDSIILAKLIDAVGWTVLEEYEGSAALVMYNKEEPNVIYAFHGRSRVTEYATLADERPLAYITFPGRGTYISSELSHLSNLSIPEKKIVPYEFKYNILYRLEGDTVMEFMEIDRTKLNQPSPKKTHFLNSGYNSKKTPIDYAEKTIYRTAIRYNAGLYVLNGEPANGLYTLDAWGYIIDKLPFNKALHFEVGFIHGVMMKSRMSYEIMKKLVDDNNIYDTEDFYDVSSFNKLALVNLLKIHSATPFWRYSETAAFVGYLTPEVCKVSGNGSHYFHGSYAFPLSRFIMKMNYGDIIEVKEDKYMITLNEFTKSSIGQNVDFSKTDDDQLGKILELVHFKKKEEPKDTTNTYGYSLPLECETCNKWSTDYDFCARSCPIYAKEDDSAEYDLALTSMKSSFKEVEDAIDTAIDTYESLSIDLKKDNVESVIDVLKETKNKLILN